MANGTLNIRSVPALLIDTVSLEYIVSVVGPVDELVIIEMVLLLPL